MINPAKQQVKRSINWRRTLRKIGNFIVSRASDLALALIIGVSGVAAFDGAHYSALRFHFVGWYAVAFALLPDALMVFSAAKMRGLRVHPEQRKAAHRSMRFGLGFSVVTNMIAALLRSVPDIADMVNAYQAHKAWWEPAVTVVGTLGYHAVVVVILWLATETATRVRTEAPSIAKQDNASRTSGPVAQPRQSTQKPNGRKGSATPKTLTPTTVVPMTSKNADKVNGVTPSGLIVARR